MSGLFSDPPFPTSATNALNFRAQTLIEEARRRRVRGEWNDRFEHWEKPASVSEEATIERAQANVVAAIAQNSWLSAQNVAIRPQGSYHNNTNVRTEADIDLRAVHPFMKIEYADNTNQALAWRALGYSNGGISFRDLFNRLRSELDADLSRRFGAANLSHGKKAIRIKGITGSRAEVDVVPSVLLHFVQQSASPTGGYEFAEGVALLSTDNNWTYNFPEQHTRNGVAKRARTLHRFKRIVRILKRMRADMEDHGVLTVRVPSFLVECLVYLVEDWYFLQEEDDRYGRVRRVVNRIQERLAASSDGAGLHEINDLKWLFYSNQAWTFQDVVTFINSVVAHLGDL